MYNPGSAFALLDIAGDCSSSAPKTLPPFVDRNVVIHEAVLPFTDHVTPFFRSYPDYLLKVPAECLKDRKTYLLPCLFQAVLRSGKDITRFLNTDQIYIGKRRYVHAGHEHPPKVALAHMAYLSKVTHLKVLVVVFANILYDIDNITVILCIRNHDLLQLRLRIQPCDFNNQ